jgi:type IV pilus assembly protein PilW
MINRAQRGFTLIEVMVAMTIGLVISALVVTIFSASSSTYKAADTIGALQETGRVALENIDHDVQMAGFRGCNSNNVEASGPLLNVIATPTAFSNDLGNAIQGYEFTGPGWTPALPAAITGAAPAPAANSDVLVVRVGVGTPGTLSAPMVSATSDIPLFSAAGFNVGDNVFIADCNETAAFRVTGIAGTSLRHTVAATTNTNASLGQVFAGDAIAMRFETHAYYVAPSSRNPATETSLWMLSSAAAGPVEVVEDVEGLQIQYGEDTDADYVANVFRKANSVVDFTQVVALQVNLLLRGARSNEAQQVTNYVFNGQTVVPGDGYTRRVYTATIQIRNRTL